MTTYLYSDITNGEQIAFDPKFDVLHVDASGLSAADFALTVSTDGGGVLWASPDRSFTLNGLSVTALNATNVVFDDGSLLVSSNVFNNYTASLTGSSHDDLLIGSTAARPVAFVATNQQGDHTDSDSTDAIVSADGRFVVFVSPGNDLTGKSDTNGLSDIFVKDLLTGSVMRASETAAGGDASYDNSWGSMQGVISADGRFVAFVSSSGNLVPGDTNGGADIFLKDLHTGAVTGVSTSTSGDQANAGGTSGTPSISADGRYVAFTSGADNLVSGDTNNALDIFVKDSVTGVLTRVSTSSSGAQGNAGLYDYGSNEATISADGHFVVFKSFSTNLVSGDDNGAYSADVFVKNLTTGEIKCASTDLNG